MGKTPKKAAPWGDERNLCKKLVKATSKTSESHSHNRQRESENPNRSKLTTQLRKVPPGQRKGFKNKVSTTVKFDSSCPTKQNPWLANSPKKKKKSTENKGTESNSKMQPESETGEIKVDETSGNKSCAKPETSKEIRNSAEKHVVDHPASEPVRDSSKEEEQRNGESEKDQTKTEKTEEKLNKSVETKQLEVHVEHEDTDLKLTLENDENSEKSREEEIVEEPKSKENEKVRIEVESCAQEKDEAQSVSLNDTEGSTVELTESMKSSSTEVSESTSQNEERIEMEKVEETTTTTTAKEKEVSFLTYDSTIMLKDVQIKLNDCMKETTNTSEANNTVVQQAEQVQDQECTLPPRPSDDLSFGKTLRNISGRRSIGRMRHVTIREQRYSPNNSMFVNTSGTSLMPDENEDFKILRYNTGVSETISASNGSSMEKKRKQETIEDRAGKKQKTETENSMLSTSISLLKGLRRPIQASTPVAELKFQSNKLDLLDDERDKSVNDHQTTKKWCPIM